MENIFFKTNLAHVTSLINNSRKLYLKLAPLTLLLSLNAFYWLTLNTQTLAHSSSNGFLNDVSSDSLINEMLSEKKINNLFYPNLSQLSINDYWRMTVKNHQLDPKKQAFCYIDTNGDVLGSNTTIPLPLGSVSKLFTSLLAIKKYGLNYQFKTKVYLSSNQQWLHLEGGLDPLFADKQWWFLLSLLKKLKISRVNKITYDDHFLFFPYLFTNPTYEHLSHQKDGTILGPLRLTSSLINSYLSRFSNTSSFNEKQQQRLKYLSQLFPNEIDAQIQFSAKIVEKNNDVTTGNNFKNFNLLFEISSSPLSELLKYINTYSNNGAAELLYQPLAADNALQRLLTNEELLGPSEKFYFFTGSGIPLTITKNATGVIKRYINLVSCKTTALVLAKINWLIGHQEVDEKNLNDLNSFPAPTQGEPIRTPLILPVNGLEGTLRQYAQSPKTFTGKTGTLRTVKTLAVSYNLNSGNRNIIFLGQAKSSSERSVLVHLFQVMINELGNRFSGKKNIFYPHIFHEENRLFITKE